MTGDDASKLRIVSLGLVVINKPLRTYTIEVVPTERSPFLSGEATDHVTEYTAKSEGGDGADPVDLALKVTQSYPAEWLPIGNTNRITAPDVRRGEEVLILQFADSPKYFWIEWRANPTLRRLETITYTLSNERRENVPLDKTNTYVVHVSTHEKLIHIETTKSDGEPFAYIIQLNTKDGIFIIKDDVGNHFLFNSRDTQLEMRNKNGTYIELVKKVLNMEGVDEINMKTKKFNLNASQSIKMFTKDYTINTTNYTMNSVSFKLKGNSGTLDATMTTTKNHSIGGNLRVAGTSTHIGQSIGPGHR